MALLSYFNTLNLERDNTGDLGILRHTTFGTSFYPLGFELDALLNDDNFTAFSCQVDIGSCTFSKEFKKSGNSTKAYWYASKKVNGKLKRVYHGAKPLYLEALMTILDKFNDNTKLEREVYKSINANAIGLADEIIDAIASVTDKPIIELAGNGKSDRHLQRSLISENQALTMAQTEIKALKEQNEILINRIIDSTELYQEKWQKSSKLEDEVKQLHKTVTQLERKASKDEEFLLGYKFCAEQDHEALYELECKFHEMQSIIDKYRALTDGKTRQSHPRFNKLLDFLADIDKLS